MDAPGEEDCTKARPVKARRHWESEKNRCQCLFLVARAIRGRALPHRLQKNDVLDDEIVLMVGG